MNNTEIVSKGSLIGLAMVCISAGITQIVNDKLLGGIILLIAGFGFVMWREYLKAKYNKIRETKKSKKK
jgi:hypothetical protein